MAHNSYLANIAKVRAAVLLEWLPRPLAMIAAEYCQVDAAAAIEEAIATMPREQYIKMRSGRDIGHCTVTLHIPVWQRGTVDVMFIDDTNWYPDMYSCSYETVAEFVCSGAGPLANKIAQYAGRRTDFFRRKIEYIVRAVDQGRWDFSKRKETNKRKRSNSK